MVELVLNQELRPLVVSRSYSNVVLLAWMIKVSKPPINESQIFFLVINYDIKWFYISVHYTVRVTVVQSLQKLI